jgi:CP family cyanate transporter-like MFS transporter
MAGGIGAGLTMATGSVRAGHTLLLATVVLVGLNLRPFLTGPGPLTASIVADTGLGLRGMAWLTLLPMLLMGVCAFFTPWLQAAFGVRRAVLGALAMLGIGIAARQAVTGGGALIATAALCGLGVAVVQAVFPAVVKQRFPGAVAPVMGLYSAALVGGGAVGAQAAPLLARWTGDWHPALAWFAVPVALAMLLVALAIPREERTAGPAARPRISVSWLRISVLIACFGLINSGYSTVVAWLAPFYQAHGWTGTASGTLVAVMASAQAVAALALPALAARGNDRRPWLWLALALQAAGFAGLAFAPDVAPALWAMACGAGLGGCFALCLVVALDQASDPLEAGAVSALMQGGGFIIAAGGPWIAAALHDLTGTFAAAWLAHLAAVICVCGLLASLRPAGPSGATDIAQAEARRAGI